MYYSGLYFYKYAIGRQTGAPGRTSQSDLPLFVTSQSSANGHWPQ